MDEFIGRQIQVRCEGFVRKPVLFRLGDEEHKIEAIAEEWQDWGFGKADRQRNWRTRHHRNYYRVRTTAGYMFDIYCDRSQRARPAWYAHKRLSEPTGA
jgi:hypothetical protein